MNLKLKPTPNVPRFASPSHWLAAISLCLFCTGALAWGKDGHRVVGIVADSFLSAKARLAVHKIMGSDSLADVANWMDEVRQTPQGDAMRNWHFDNVNVCTQGPAPCPKGECASQQIEHALQTLRLGASQNLANPAAQTPGFPAAPGVPASLDALRVLVHLVGDIHQPLHAADNGDHGGNGVTILNRQACVDRESNKLVACKLHQYWDSNLVRKAMRGRSEKQFALGLSSKISPAEPTTGSAGATNASSAAQVAAWIGQSNTLAKSTVYHYDQFACHAAGAEVTLGNAYDEAALVVVRQQLALAGVRLAGLLNAVYAPR